MRTQHGITGDAADRIYERLLAFANFGFAESHALSFAALVFYSSWLKLHHPAAFCAALLRAQPMGFYSPQSLVADARRHGVTVRRPDINASKAQADLEPGTGRQTGGPVGPGRDPHHRHRARRADRRRTGRPAGTAPGRAHQGGHPDHRPGRGAGHRRGAGRADRDASQRRARDRRRALWAAGAAAGPTGRHAARQRRRPGGAGAARDERHRTDRRRHLGDRDLPGVLSDRVLPAAARRVGGADRDRACTRSSTAPGCWSPGWSPTGSARPPPPGSSSSTWRTRPGWSTSSARSGCGPGTGGSPAGRRRC